MYGYFPEDGFKVQTLWKKITIYHNNRKVIRIVRAYHNYVLFEQDLLKKCAGEIVSSPFR